MDIGKRFAFETLFHTGYQKVVNFTMLLGIIFWHLNSTAKKFCILRKSTIKDNNNHLLLCKLIFLWLVILSLNSNEPLRLEVRTRKIAQLDVVFGITIASKYPQALDYVILRIIRTRLKIRTYIVWYNHRVHSYSSSGKLRI